MYFHIKIFAHLHQVKNTFLAFLTNTNHSLWLGQFFGDFAICQSANLFVYEKRNNLPPRIFLFTFREESFAKKKNEKFKEWILRKCLFKLV